MTALSQKLLEQGVTEWNVQIARIEKSVRSVITDEDGVVLGPLTDLTRAELNPNGGRVSVSFNFDGWRFTGEYVGSNAEPFSFNLFLDRAINDAISVTKLDADRRKEIKAVNDFAGAVAEHATVLRTKLNV